jgi:hypothetical protein
LGDPWDTPAASGDSLFRFAPTPDPPSWRREDFPNVAWEPTVEEIEAIQTDDFLEEVYTLATLGDFQEATDEIFQTIDRLLLDGAFTVCNEMLRRADIRKLPLPLMRSFLTITAAAKDKLPARKSFYSQVLSEMRRLKGEDKAQRLLGKLA